MTIIFLRNLILLLIFTSAFLIGNAGWGGTTFVTCSTFIVSIFCYGAYCILQGPPQQEKRSPWIQGFMLIMHGAGAFCSVLIYVWRWHEGLSESISFEQGWQYWEDLFYNRPYLSGTIIAGILCVSLVSAVIAVIEQSDY